MEEYLNNLSLPELKSKAEELDISKEEIKKYGVLTKKATWLAALTEITAVKAKEKTSQEPQTEAVATDADSKAKDVEVIDEAKAKAEFDQATKSVKNHHEVFLKLIKGLDNLDDFETATTHYINSLFNRCGEVESTFKQSCSELIKQVKAAFSNPPDNLKKVYKNHNNFCVVTFIYEAQTALLEGKNQPVETTSKKELQKAVILDYQPIISQLTEDLQSDDWVILGTAIAGLTGRRPVEVFSISKFDVVDENHIKISNLAKKRDNNSTKFEYTIPVLAHADDIFEAYEKLRRIKPLGMMTPEKFDNNIAGGDGLRKQFREKRGYLFHDCDKDSFGATRNFYASAITWMAIDSMGWSISDAITKTKECMGHEAEGTSLKYTTVKYINLPQQDEAFFMTAKTEVKIEIIGIDLVEYCDSLTGGDLLRFRQICEKYPDNWVKIFHEMTVSGKQSTGQVVNKIIPETASNRIEKVIRATLAHNEKLLADKSILETEKLYVYITKGMIDTLCLAILERRQAPKTLTDVFERFRNQVDKSNEWNQPGTNKVFENKKLNLHIRSSKKNTVKMDTVIASIKNEYLQM